MIRVFRRKLGPASVLLFRAHKEEWIDFGCHTADKFPKHSSVGYRVSCWVQCVYWPNLQGEYQSMGCGLRKSAGSDPKMTKGMILYHPRYDTVWVIMCEPAPMYLFPFSETSATHAGSRLIPLIGR